MSDMIKNDVGQKSKESMDCIAITRPASISHGCAFAASSTGENSKPAIWRWRSGSCATSKTSLERTDATKGNTSFAKVLDDYVATLTGADSTTRGQARDYREAQSTWFGIDSLPLRAVKPSQVTTWMSKHYGGKSASYYNSALTVIRSALDMAVEDKIITENPASDLKYRKRNKPIRLTPTLRAIQGRSSRTSGRRSSTAKRSRAGTLSSSWDWPD